MAVKRKMIFEELFNLLFLWMDVQELLDEIDK
jgi:hypothetical protein